MREEAGSRAAWQERTRTAKLLLGVTATTLRVVWGASGPAAHPSMLLGQPGTHLHHAESTASSPRAGPTGPAASRLAAGLQALPMLSRGGAGAACLEV